MTDDPKIVHEVVTPTGRDIEDITYHQTSTPGVKVTDQFRAFLQQAIDGRLPKVDVPEVAPEVRALAEELAVLHLPEWTNPAGRKLAEPTVITMTQAPRIAAYLIARGYRLNPEEETIRWAPTPGGLPGPHDVGLHYGRGDDGSWPIPNVEEYWSTDDIEVSQLPDGSWKGEHPRGIAYQAATKADALAGIVDLVRAKIAAAGGGAVVGDSLTVPE